MTATGMPKCTWQRPKDHRNSTLQAPKLQATKLQATKYDFVGNIVF